MPEPFSLGNPLTWFEVKPTYLLQQSGWRDTTFRSRSSFAMFGLAVGLFVAARGYHLTKYSLWLDEIWTLQAAKLNLSDLLNYAVNDVVHPPLFYLLVKAWIGMGGDSLLWLKLFPLLTSIATIVPFFLLCRELKLPVIEMNLALVLMAVNGYLIYFAQELRAYSLLLLFTLCSLWLFVRFFNAQLGLKRALLALFAANLLLVYTHYYGWLVIGLESIFLLFWERRKLPSFLTSVGVLIVCFSPWAYLIVQAAIRKKGLAGNLVYYRRPDLMSVVKYYESLNGPFNSLKKTLAGLCLFGFPVVVWGWNSLKRNPNSDEGKAVIFSWLLFLSFLPVAISYSVSQVLPQPVWAPRHLIIAAAPYMILIAISVSQLRPNWFRTTMIVLVVAWATSAGFKEPSDSNRVAWKELVQQMIQAERPDANYVKVYSFEAKISVTVAMRFYLELAKETRFQVVAANELLDLAGDHFWVVYRTSEEKKERFDRVLTGGGYQVGEGFEASAAQQKVFLFPVSKAVRHADHDLEFAPHP